MTTLEWSRKLKKTEFRPYYCQPHFGGCHGSLCLCYYICSQPAVLTRDVHERDKLFFLFRLFSAALIVTFFFYLSTHIRPLQQVLKSPCKAAPSHLLSFLTRSSSRMQLVHTKWKRGKFLILIYIYIYIFFLGYLIWVKLSNIEFRSRGLRVI